MPTLKRWLPMAGELSQVDGFYDTHPDYLYPPFFLVLLRPLTHVSPTAAVVIWQVGKYVSLVLIFGICWGLFAKPEPLAQWVKFLTVVLCLRFIVSDLGHGNVNIFICLLVVGAVWMLARGRPVVCGLLVAFAACIKVTPALWGVYLVYKRRWRAVVGLAVGCLIALEVVPWVVTTPGGNHRLLAGWYRRTVTDYAERGHVYSTGMNQSLVAVTNRLLGRSELAPDETPVAVVDLDDGTIVWIQRVLMLGIVCLLGWCCRGRGRDDDHTTLLAEWSLVGAATLALSGYTWTGHFCLLIPAQVVLFAELGRPGRRGRDRVVLVLTVLAQVLFVFTSDLITSAGREWSKSVGLLLLGVVFLGAALIVLREQRRGKIASVDGKGGASVEVRS